MKVNDAVCIVIYNIIKKFSESGETFTGETIINMLVTFVKLFGLSFFIGLSIGYIGSLCLKKLKAYILEEKMNVL